MPEHTRLAAAIQLGLIVEHHWKFKDQQHAEKLCDSGFEWILIPEPDKEYIRKNIAERLYNQTNKQIIKQYQRVMKSVARLDYPERWSSFMQHDITKLLEM